MLWEPQKQERVVEKRLLGKNVAFVSVVVCAIER